MSDTNHEYDRLIKHELERGANSNVASTTKKISRFVKHFQPEYSLETQRCKGKKYYAVIVQEKYSKRFLIRPQTIIKNIRLKK